jgi:hypothetical protein
MLKYIVFAAIPISWTLGGFLAHADTGPSISFWAIWTALLCSLVLFVLFLKALFRRRWREVGSFCAMAPVVLLPYLGLNVSFSWLYVAGFRLHAGPPEAYLSRCKLTGFVEKDVKQKVGVCERRWWPAEGTLTVIYDTAGQSALPVSQRTPEWTKAIERFVARKKSWPASDITAVETYGPADPAVLKRDVITREGNGNSTRVGSESVSPGGVDPMNSTQGTLPHQASGMTESPSSSLVRILGRRIGNQPPEARRPQGIVSGEPVPFWPTPLPFVDLFGNSNAHGDNDWFTALARGRERRKTSPASVFDNDASESDDASLSGGLPGRLATVLAAMNPTRLAPATDEGTQGISNGEPVRRLVRVNGNNSAGSAIDSGVPEASVGGSDNPNSSHGLADWIAALAGVAPQNPMQSAPSPQGDGLRRLYRGAPAWLLQGWG